MTDGGNRGMSETLGRPVTRRLLVQGAAGGIAALSLRARTARAAGGTVRWVSPRGTIEVLDDYPYWVAKKFGYFGDIATTLEPGPLEATATVKLVDQGQSDMGYPSPGVFSLGLEQGIKLVSVFQMGAYDVFDIAFRQGEKPADIKSLQGKTVVLGSAGWQAICDPWFAQAGLAPGSIKYVEAGNGWAQALAQGKGRRGAELGRIARAVEGPGSAFRLRAGPDVLALSRQLFRHPRCGLRRRREEAAV